MEDQYVDLEATLDLINDLESIDLESIKDVD